MDRYEQAQSVASLLREALNAAERDRFVIEPNADDSFHVRSCAGDYICIDLELDTATGTWEIV
jgi:hypothetical protein